MEESLFSFVGDHLSGLSREDRQIGNERDPTTTPHQMSLLASVSLRLYQSINRRSSHRLMPWQGNLAA